MSGCPIHVIGNGVRSFGTRGQAEREKLILGVGRLSSEKGFDRTIAAFAELANEAPDWKLVIIGEGPKRSELERQISDLQLDERIQLPGFQDSVAEWYQRASIFVLSSSYEGFPNALLEAMAAGCAVIAADCESGPSEIVRHEIDGWLIPPSNREALTVRLRDAIRNPELCRELGIRAKNVTDRFSMESCFDAWDALIAESIKSGRSA